MKTKRVGSHKRRGLRGLARPSTEPTEFVLLHV